MRNVIQTKYILLITGIDSTRRLKMAISFAMVLRSRGIMSLLTLAGSAVSAKNKMQEFGYEVVATGGEKRQSGLMGAILGAFTHNAAVKNAGKLISLKSANGVITMGGQSGIAYIEAAKQMGVKTFLFEANAILSPGNEKIVGLVDKIFVAFKDLGDKFDPKKAVVTGTPVEKRIMSAESRNIPTDKKIMVVFKCEVNSNSMNDLIRSMFTKYPEMRREFFVLQETGEKDVASVKRFYDSVQVEALCYMSYENRGKYYQTADLILCRPTCDVIGELVALKKPGVLMPLSPKQNKYQRENAKLMGKNRLAYIVEDTGSMAIRTKKLFRALSAFINDPNQLTADCERMDFLNAATRLANEIDRNLSGK